MKHEKKQLNIAILHDWITGYRGGERVLEAICELFPEAKIYTLLHNIKSSSPFLEQRIESTSFLNFMPGKKKHYRKLLPLMPMAAKSIHLPKNLDLVISSSHCVIKGVPKPQGVKHLCYIHSPMRYIYDQFDHYFPKSSPLKRFIAKIFRPYLKWWDKRSNQNVDFFLANSHFVKKRIETYYRENTPCDVLHPFVDLKDFLPLQKTPPPKENFYLILSAFAPNKRVDLAIQAFNHLKRPLKIIGSGSIEDTQKLHSLADENIEFLGNLSREEVLLHLFKTQALIFPGVEDFGITPLESLAAGTPVIAYQAGGVLETLNSDVAVFFKALERDALCQAVETFEQSFQFEREKLIERANFFSKEKFQKSFINILKAQHFIDHEVQNE